MAAATTRFSGRAFSAQELRLIREIVRDCSGLSRMELARTVCELLRWRRPNGRLKARECREFLERLDADGTLVLPDKRRGRAVGSVTRVPRTAAGEPGRPLRGTVRDVEPLAVELVREPAERLLFRELVGRYHYLGHTVPFGPFGAHLRYLVFASRPARAVVGCLQFSSPAWRMAARDRWVGWDDATRARNLQRVVNNSRFLLLPWVAVRNLASAVLARGSGSWRWIGRAATTSSPGSWRRWWTRAATTAVRTAPPTGSRWARPVVEGAWTGTAAAPVRRPRRSWSILWSGMRSGGCGRVDDASCRPPCRSPRPGAVCDGGGRLRRDQSVPLFARGPANE